MIGRQDHNGPRGNGVNEETAFTLTATDVSGVAAIFNRQRSDAFKEQDLACTQSARQHTDATDLICEYTADADNADGKAGVNTANAQNTSAVDCRNYKEIGNISGTLQAKDPAGYSLNFQNPVRIGSIVRRLTPPECERLQGYPDGWTQFGHDGKEISDTRRYQMLGNSVAVPCVAYIMLGIAAQYLKEAAE
jgi:DNA (cytosine-5)-methyltransferase 1